MTRESAARTRAISRPQVALAGGARGGLAQD
jgi:hypothetical protein